MTDHEKEILDKIQNNSLEIRIIKEGAVHD